MTSRVAAGLGFLVVAALVALTASAPAYATEQAKPQVVFTITSPQITESSSLAMSTTHPGLVYTTNDSGDDGTVYVLDASSGAVVGRTTLAGAAPLDVEAIAAGSDGSLIVADIGDNNADHSTADLYRIDQPGPGEHAVTPDRVDLTYVGGPRDAESVVYDASTGTAYVVSKLLGGAKVYRTPPDVFQFDNAKLRPIANGPVVATDATLLPGGDFVVVRTYINASIYTFPGWKRVATFDLPPQQQGESITAPASGDVVWVGSEGTESSVLAVRLPAFSAASSPPVRPAGSSDGFGSSPDRSGRHLATVVLLGAIAGLVGLGVVATALAVRRR